MFLLELILRQEERISAISIVLAVVLKKSLGQGVPNLGCIYLFLGVHVSHSRNILTLRHLN